MALPTEKTSFEQLYVDLLFTGAYLSGTQGLAPLGKKVLDARKQVLAQAAKRNEQADERVRAHAQLSIAWDVLGAPLISFERQAAAWFDEDQEGYAQVFPSTPKSMLKQPEIHRAEALAPVLAFAKQSGLSGKIALAAKALTSAWTDYAAAARESHAADQALAAAVKALHLTKIRGVVAMREIEGELRAKFAGDPKLWKRFFRVKSGKAEAEHAAPPAGSEPPPVPPPATGKGGQ